MLNWAEKRCVSVAGKVLAAVALCLAPAIASAEAVLDFRVYPMPGGAPVSMVNDLLEDRDGAVWVVTWGEGVHRIHGTEWTTYTEAQGLPDDWVRSLSESPEGGVWVGTGEGIALIRDGRLSSITAAKLPIFGDGDVTHVRELESGRVLAGTLDGTILLRDPVGKLPDDLLEGWRVIATPEETKDRSIFGVLNTAPDEWLVSLAWGGLGWLRGDTLELDPTMPGELLLVLHEHNGVEGREIWAVDRNGGQIYRREGESWTFMEQGPPDMNDLADMDSDTVFAATQTGLFVRRGGLWAPYELDPSLGAPELSRLVATRDGALWTGGLEGLMRGTLRTWLNVLQPGGPVVILPRTRPNDPLLAINFDGVVFAPEGTSWRALFTLDPWTSKAWELDASIWLGDGRLWTDPEGGIFWIMVANGTLQTIWKGMHSTYSLEDGRRTEVQTLPPTDSLVERFVVSAGGSLLYMADDGVYRLEEGSWTPFPTVPGYRQKHAYSLVEVEPGIFWAGVQGGIERWAGDTVTHFGEAEGIQEDDDIHAILRSHTGDIWFGSMGAGLYRYDGHTFHSYTKADGLRSNSIRSILESTSGTLWIAYRSTGISALQGERWVHYGLEHGLPHASILSFFETGAGAIWIGSQSQGLFRFRPEMDAPDTEILVGPEQIDSHGIGVFSFAGRDAWNQTPIRDLQFAWRVSQRDGEGDKRWSPFSTETNVVTGELEHGEYRFEVRSSDENGNVDPTAAALEFTVSPPLWMKPGFYLPLGLSILLAAVALCFLWFSRRALLRSEAALRAEVEIRIRAEELLEQHSENLEEQVEERTRVLAQVQEELIRKERLATLGQLTATVSHELRNPLGTIQSSLFTIEKKIRGMGLGLESALDRTARSVKRCDKIIEELLDFTRANELSPQAVEVDTWLREALEDIGTPEGVQMTLDLNCAALIRIDRELMRRVLINLMDNAVQAMNEAQSAERIILVRSVARDGRAEIYVEDTGPGIPDDVLERIFEPLFSTKNFGVGLGTNIMRNIMMRHNGGIEYANREEAGGTRVLIWLPASAGES